MSHDKLPLHIIRLQNASELLADMRGRLSRYYREEEPLTAAQAIQLQGRADELERAIEAARTYNFRAHAWNAMYATYAPHEWERT